MAPPTRQPAFVPLHPLFAVAVDGLDCASIDDTAFAAVREAFEQHSVVVLRGQQGLDDAGQIAFSQRFGTLEVTAKANPGAGTFFARQSNLDAAGDTILGADDRRTLHALANQLWHSDSSFRAVPSLCSLLLARLLPDEGGHTEFASTRAAFDALPAERRDGLRGLQALHSLQHSRARVDARALTAEMCDELPAVAHPLIRTNPRHGRQALFAGAHASHIVGWPCLGGQALVDELNVFCTQPAFVYRHAWRPGDLVLWDNRAVLHRATPFDATRERRLLQRTTVAGDEAEYRHERRLAHLEDTRPTTA